MNILAHWGGLALLYGGAAGTGWFYGAGTSPGWRLAVVGLVLAAAGGAHAFVSALLMPRLLARYERRTGSRLDLRRVDSHLIGWAGLLFLVSLAVAVGWLVWSGIPTLWGCVFVASVVLLTVGYMRVVAEGGVYWFQMYGASPFHLADIFGASVVPGRVLAALVPIYSVLFLDTKTFMAPAVVSSFKMAEETRAARRRYHLVVVVSVAFTIVVASVALLYLAYEIGANRSGPWFFTDGPTRLLDHAKTLASSAPGEASPAAGIGFFVAIGAAWVVFSVAMRRKFFWWLHPIGFVMLTNPLMSTLWFSFFLGWLCKALAVKYGGRHMYARVRPFFVGVIFGQIMACFLWSVLAHALHLEHVKIDINNV